MGFKRLCPVDGYLPLRDYGLIGDGTTAALVGRNGSVDWMCLPRFDSTPLFCALVDHGNGGKFVVAPVGAVESRQYYDGDTGILITEIRSPEGLVRVTDAMTLRSGADLSEDAAAGRGELLRRIEVLEGAPRVRIAIEPREEGRERTVSGGIRMRCAGRPELDVQLSATIELQGTDTELTLQKGGDVYLLLRWGARHLRLRGSHAGLLDATRDAWRRWLKNFQYEGPQAAMVRRSAITLKLLNFFKNGAIVAAPTSSLPEVIGGIRNWDYRFCWTRDAALSVYALHRIGFSAEAAGFLAWVLDAVERAERPGVLYDLDGKKPAAEWDDAKLDGYRHSRPVRWGNAAADQVQNDLYGEILDCAFQWAGNHGTVEPPLWEELRRLVEGARRNWRQPDRGIWEVRSSSRPFTYSAAMCQVALDRGAQIAERFRLPGDAAGWRAAAGEIRDAILKEAWDPEAKTLTQHLGGGAEDASLLALPLRRVISATDPRMLATVKAIVERLGAGGGLIYRYSPDHPSDGLPGREGAFLLCSFWLLDNLARQGRVDEALELYDSLCGRAEPGLGLLPEEIDPSSGDFLGNYPQGFSHIGVISAGVALARAVRKREAA